MVGVCLPWLPPRRRGFRIVIVSEDQFSAAVEEVDERSVVLVQLPRTRLDHPGVGDLEGAPRGAVDRFTWMEGTIGLTSAALRRLQAGAQEGPGQGGHDGQPQERRNVMLVLLATESRTNR